MSDAKRALIVDDERNIRLTLRTAVEGPSLLVDEAADGREALALAERAPYDVVLLDLRMPGEGGMDVLRRLRALRPAARVVVVTAHGTVDAAVEAMKLGAADFLQKPFEPRAVREVVARVLRPETDASDRETCLAAARRLARGSSLAEAERSAVRALARDPSRPEAYHLLGIVCDLRRDRLRAQAYYRAALALDPTYRPSESNLDRSSGTGECSELRFGDEGPGESRGP